MIGVYLHIPYCRTLCPYCDFVKARARGVPEEFVDACCAEIRAYEGPYDAGSIFFGGGTPSLLSPPQLQRVMRALRDQFTLHDPEITMEVNPDDVTRDGVAAWRNAGINRVSLGVQSFDDATLRYLGRRHDAKAALSACHVIADAFPNWNADLIFGARPWRKGARGSLTPEDCAELESAWSRTIAQTLAVNPPHVAAYGLTYETGTPFEKRTDEAVDDELSLRLYQMAETSLAAYQHYEVSNYAKPGWESRHNLIYWHNRQYAGFGPGAYSYIAGVRARNHSDVDAYLSTPGEKEEALSLSDHEVRVETLIQHFRLKAGLEKSAYAQRFGHTVEEDFGPQIEALLARGLIQASDGTLRPTPQGFYLNNEIGLALVEAAATH